MKQSQSQFVTKDSKYEPPVVETKTRPAVIHETVRKEEVEEIQPIIERNREKTEFHLVTQPVQESVVLPTMVQESVLQAEYRGTVREAPSAQFEQQYKQGISDVSTQDFIQAEKKRVEKPPIIKETSKKMIVEEVQPIIYKDTLQPTIIKETLPIYEKIIEAPTLVQEVRTPIYQHPGAEPAKYQQHPGVEPSKFKKS